MSQGLLDVDAAARIIGETPSELNRLVKIGIIERQNGKFHPITLIRSYINHIKAEAKRKEESPTQLEIAKHLDMSERNLRDVLRALNMDHRSQSLSEIRVAYIGDIRDKAAGRGGDDQVNLSKARAEESFVKTAKLRLEYNREIGSLIHGEDVEGALNDWAKFTNRELLQGFHKLVAEIQSIHKITIATELVENIVIPTTERIKGHAEKLGAGLVEGVEEFRDTEN